jgi:hypothetical protein
MPNPNDNPARTNGPFADGSRSLAKESRVGLAVTFVTYAVVDGIVDALVSVDLSGREEWWAGVATAGIATIVGLGSAWLKRNR